jgi:hypothetical protein
LVLLRSRFCSSIRRLYSLARSSTDDRVLWVDLYDPELLISGGDVEDEDSAGCCCCCWREAEAAAAGGCDAPGVA